MPGTGAAAGPHSPARGKASRQAPEPGLHLTAPDSRSCCCCCFTDVRLQTLWQRRPALALPPSFVLHHQILNDQTRGLGQGGRTLLGDQERACGKQRLKENSKAACGEAAPSAQGRYFWSGLV